MIEIFVNNLILSMNMVSCQVDTRKRQKFKSCEGHQKQHFGGTSRMTLLFLCLLTVLLSGPKLARACTPSDWVNLIGGPAVMMQSIQVAPDNKDNLLVAFVYKPQHELEVIGAFYLFNMVDCSYKWHYQLKTSQDNAIAAIWSPDYTKAYVQFYSAASGGHLHLIEINTPYDLTTSGQRTKQYSWYVGGNPTINRAQNMFALNPGTSSVQELMLVASQQYMRIFLNPGRNFVTTSAHDISKFINYSCQSPLSNSIYMLEFLKDFENIQNSLWRITKTSGTNLKYDLQVTWPINSSMDEEARGTMDVISDSGGHEVVFMAGSQGFTKITDPGFDGVDFVRTRFKNNELRCEQKFCKRLVSDVWAKVLSTRAVDENNLEVLMLYNPDRISVSNEVGGGGPPKKGGGGRRRLSKYENLTLVLANVDFDARTIQLQNQDVKWTQLDFMYGTLFQSETIARPYYKNGVFQDHILTLIMTNTPENAWSTRKHMLAAITRTGPAFRANNMFNSVTDADLQVDGSATFTEVDQTDVTESFMNQAFDKIRDTSQCLRFANMKTGTGDPLLDHGAIETVRHVELNSAPITFDGQFVFSLKYTVGQNLWTTFPRMNDEEGNGEQPWNLVSYSYVESYPSMPRPVDEFYRVFPSLNVIQGYPYRQENVGLHALNVTIADDWGSQAWFRLNIVVTSLVPGETPQKQSKPNPLGQEAALLQQLGGDLEAFAAAKEQIVAEIESGDLSEEEKTQFFESLSTDLGIDELVNPVIYCDELPDRQNRPPGRHLAPEGEEGEFEEEPGEHEEHGPSGGPGKGGPGGPGGPGKGGPQSHNLSATCIEREIELDFEEEIVTEIEIDVFEFDASEYSKANGCLSEADCATVESFAVEDVTIDNRGNIKIVFNQRIPFAEVWRKSKQDSPQRRLEEDDHHEEHSSEYSKDLFKTMFSLEMETEFDGHDHEEEPDFSFEIADITDTTVLIQIRWKNYEELSADGADFMLVTVEIPFELLDTGENLSFTQLIEIPKQEPHPDDVVVQEVKKEGSSAGDVVGAAAATTVTLVLRTVMVGALSQLWGLINGLSLFVHLPMIANVEIPEFSKDILGQLIEVAQFDIVENELVYGEFIPFPEDVEHLLKPKIVDTGYESNFAAVNMGTNVIIITILFVFILLLALFLPCHRQDNIVGRNHKKCSGIIFWGFWLRMLIQGCLEIEISALNYIIDRDELIEIYKDEPSYDTFFWLNDFLSYSLMTVLLIMPVWVTVFYCYNFNKLGNEQFAERYGSTYDGLRTERRSILFFPVYFLVRRLIFLMITIYGDKYPSFQLFCLLIMTIISLLYLLLYKPFDIPLLQNLEVFNEFTSLALLYTTFCWIKYDFHEDGEEEVVWRWIPEDQLRNEIGYFFNAVMGLNVSVHLYFLFRSVYRDCKLNAKKKKFKKLRDQQITIEEQIKQDATASGGKKSSTISSLKGLESSASNTRPRLQLELSLSQVSEQAVSEESSNSQQSQSESEQEVVESEQQKRLPEGRRPRNIHLLSGGYNVQRSLSKTGLMPADQKLVPASIYSIQPEVDASDIFLTPRQGNQYETNNQGQEILEIVEEQNPTQQLQRVGSQEFNLDDAYEDFVVNSIQNKIPPTQVEESKKEQDEKPEPTPFEREMKKKQPKIEMLDLAVPDLKLI